MLAALSIRDIVLIDSLDLDFERGLTVLSGETGAGKSILLDALALALGARGDAGLVRHGADQGSVAAVFSLAAGAGLSELLDEHGIDFDGDLVLRRIQYRDGRTRGFVNDQPVSAKLMRDVGQRLVEIHGQHDERALLDPASHLALVDAFGEFDDQAADLRLAWRALRDAEAALAAHEAETARALSDADYLRHATDELSALAAEVGEEARLADERKLMIEGERIAEDLARAHEAVAGEGGSAARLTTAVVALERAAGRAGGLVDEVLSALQRADAELSEATHALEQVISGAEADPARLEEVEERLFALRAAARKHGVDVDELPAFAARLTMRLAAIEGGEEELARLRSARDAARADYLERARALSESRTKAARSLDAAVMAELAPLRLEAARFSTAIETVDDSRAGPSGLDRAEFMIAANLGTPAGPLRRVASGGELSRVMLALKVALTGRGGAPTLIFDEIDSGVGGAVADAVGERLQRLGSSLQVLVVTHSPQVAARGDDHLLIVKAAAHGDGNRPPSTMVRRLGETDRREEIARMLAGASVTEEARAAASRLIGSRGA